MGKYLIHVKFPEELAIVICIWLNPREKSYVEGKEECFKSFFQRKKYSYSNIKDLVAHGIKSSSFQYS